MTPVTFDKWGRPYRHHELHAKTGKLWTTGDIRFLIENYYSLGREEVSIHLQRTCKAVSQRASELRRDGRLVRPKRIRTHKRKLRGKG